MYLLSLRSSNMGCQIQSNLDGHPIRRTSLLDGHYHMFRQILGIFHIAKPLYDRQLYDRNLHKTDTFFCFWNYGEMVVLVVFCSTKKMPQCFLLYFLLSLCNFHCKLPRKMDSSDIEGNCYTK